MLSEAVYEALQVSASLRVPVARRRRNFPPPAALARARAALLIRRAHPPEEPRLVAEARAFALSVPAPVRLQICLSLDGSQAYIYAWLESAALAAGVRGEARPARLSPLAEWQGASPAGDTAAYHYVVATDVDAEHEAEFNRWYDREHMPALAAVPGAVRCARLVSADGGPRYHACYDLSSPSVLDCREWRAVRESAWSSRMRPHFRNPRRMMFRTLLDERRLGVSGAYF